MHVSPVPSDLEKCPQAGKGVSSCPVLLDMVLEPAVSSAFFMASPGFESCQAQFLGWSESYTKGVSLPSLPLMFPTSVLGSILTAC